MGVFRCFVSSEMRLALLGRISLDMSPVAGRDGFELMTYDDTITEQKVGIGWDKLISSHNCYAKKIISYHLHIKRPCSIRSWESPFPRSPRSFVTFL